MTKAIIFLTGMSGTGKSTILKRLADEGYKTIDTDYNQLSINVYNAEQDEYEWIWDEDKIKKVLINHTEGILFMSGTVSNQGKFYDYFNEIINLSAPIDIILERVQNRTTNPYGKTEAEKKEIIQNFEQFAAIIESSSTRSIDSTRKIDDIVNEIESLANASLR